LDERAAQELLPFLVAHNFALKHPHEEADRLTAHLAAGDSETGHDLGARLGEDLFTGQSEREILRAPQSRRGGGRLQRPHRGEVVGGVDDDRRDPAGEPAAQPVDGQVATVGTRHTVGPCREPDRGEPGEEPSLPVDRCDCLVEFANIQDVPVAQRVEVTDEVRGGPDVVGPDVWEPVSELIAPADIDQWEAIVKQPPDLIDRGVAADEDGPVSELKPAQRGFPTDMAL
jgi:hypothetical protein